MCGGMEGMGRVWKRKGMVDAGYKEWKGLGKAGARVWRCKGGARSGVFSHEPQMADET